MIFFHRNGIAAMSHSYKIHFFHLIWSTQSRKPLISPEIKEHLYPYMGGIIKNLNGTLLEIGGMPDHVHLLIHMNNLDKYSYFIRDVKCESSLFINKKFDLPSKFAWQKGFASISASFSLVDRIRNYIKNQEQHHKKFTFEEEFIKFLNDQNIPFDKRFVFD